MGLLLQCDHFLRRDVPLPSDHRQVRRKGDVSCAGRATYPFPPGSNTSHHHLKAPPDPFDSIDQGTAVGDVVLFIYYSAYTQTSTGFGDVTPLHPIPQLLSTVQMSFGMLFVLVIISQTVGRMGGPRLRHEPPSTRWGRMTHQPWLHLLRGSIRKYLLVVTVCVQMLNYIILAICDVDSFAIKPQGHHHAAVVLWSLAAPQLASMLIQIIQLVMVIMVSWKYVRRAQEVRVSFMLQCFLATTLAFAGIHVMVFLLDERRDGYELSCQSDATSSCQQLGGAAHGATGFWLYVWQFCYFSLGIMTSTGYGDIYARSTLARLATVVQMLVATLFTVVIFGLGMRYLGVEVPSYPSNDSPASPQLLTEPTSPSLDGRRSPLLSPQVGSSEPPQMDRERGWSYGLACSPTPGTVVALWCYCGVVPCA